MTTATRAHRVPPVLLDVEPDPDGDQRPAHFDLAVSEAALGRLLGDSAALPTDGRGSGGGRASNSFPTASYAAGSTCSTARSVAAVASLRIRPGDAPDIPARRRSSLLTG